MKCELSRVEISSDPSFSLSRIATEPHRKAVNAVAVSNGWPAEALFQGFSANIGWLENVKTRLVDSEGSLHVRTPNIAAFMGGPPSTRKSSLHDFVTKWCVNHPDVAEDLCEGKAFSGDGIIKGHRMALLNNCRSGTTSAEGSSVYETPFSENTKGVNYVSRVKQLQFVNAERDSCVTAAGALSLDLYSYFHWVLAQIPVCEHILRPSETGFTKRFHILFCSGAECNAAQECQASREFLRNYCGWMGRKAEPFNQRHYPDGFAKSMMMSALKAAEEFLADAPAANRFWVQKVLFGDTDLSKFANVAMRSTQYCASLTQIPETDCVHTRMEYDVYEMASALHQWIRQLHIHYAYVRSRPASELQLQATHSRGSPTDAPPLEWAPVQTIGDFESSLSQEDYLQRMVIKKSSGDIATIQKVRLALKHHLKARAIKNPSGVLRATVNALANAKLVDIQDGDDNKKKKGGWPEMSFRKRSWAAIQQDDSAQAAATRLRLSADNFDA